MNKNQVIMTDTIETDAASDSRGLSRNARPHRHAKHTRLSLFLAALLACTIATECASPTPRDIPEAKVIKAKAPSLYPDTPLLSRVLNIDREKGLDPSEYLEIKKLFDDRAGNFGENTVELAHFITILGLMYVSRSQRIIKAINDPCAVNRGFIDYLSVNSVDDLKEGHAFPPKLLAHVPPNKMDSVMKAWYLKSDGHARIKKLRDESLKVLGALIDDDLSDMPAYVRVDMEHFHSRDKFIDNYSNIQNNTTDMEDNYGFKLQTVVDFHKLVKYLISRETPEETLMMTYLYYKSHIRYEYTPYLHTAMDMLKHKKGDCLDGASFIYSVMRTRGESPRLYAIRNENLKYGHAIISIRLNERYYFCDIGFLSVHDDFMQGMNYFINPSKCGKTFVADMHRRPSSWNNDLMYVELEQARSLRPR